MANCSIPNWTQATGRTSTPWSRLLRRQNNLQPSSSIPYAKAALSRRTPRHASRPKGRCTIAVSPFPLFPVSFLPRRVKGAWWPSRSSKPLSVSHTRDRGRFDSYPLRLPSLVILSGAKRNRTIPWNYRWVPPRDSSTSLRMTSNRKGGDR
jgi:hypothetical protein